MMDGAPRQRLTDGRAGTPVGQAWRWVTVAVFLAAMAARVWPVVNGAGLSGSYAYDGPVYYAASDSLLHGRIPYREFVLLHPPGLMVMLLPFASLGSLVGDQIGFITANVAFTVLGAINASVVVAIGRRANLSWRAAGMGGLFYAVFVEAAIAEYLVRLEPLGNFFTLSALYALVRGRQERGVGWLFVAGACAGASAGVKIWWLVPMAIMIVWPAPGVHWLRAGVVKAAGAAVALSAICLPFAVLAPRQMFSMVVTDQLGRPPRGVAVTSRLRAMTGVHALQWMLPTGDDQTVFTYLVSGIFLVVCLFACRHWLGRLATVVAAATITILLVAPSWYHYYADFVMPACALIVATGLAGVSSAFRRSPATAADPAEPSIRPASRVVGGGRSTPEHSTLAAALLGVSVTVAVLSLKTTTGPSSLPVNQLKVAVRSAHCVSSDSPMILIATNTLSADLRRGCTTWVDTSGAVYGPYAPTRLPNGQLERRGENKRWQQALMQYLSSGAVNVVARDETGVSRRTRIALSTHGVLLETDDITVYGAAR